MDIQVSSNFERLLFELLDRDAAATAALMRDFRQTGRMPVPDAAWRAGDRACSRASASTIRRPRRRSAACMPRPATSPTRIRAIGIAAARGSRPACAPVVAMATAHPAKFPDAVEKATGTRPSLPPRLAHLMTGTERFARAPNDLAAVETLLRAFVHRNDTQPQDPWGTAA